MSSHRSSLADKINRSRRLRYMTQSGQEVATSSHESIPVHSQPAASAVVAAVTSKAAPSASASLATKKSEKRKALAKAHMLKTSSSGAAATASNNTSAQASLPTPSTSSSADDSSQEKTAPASSSYDSLAEKRRRARQRVVKSKQPIVESYSNESSGGVPSFDTAGSNHSRNALLKSRLGKNHGTRSPAPPDPPASKPQEPLKPTPPPPSKSVTAKNSTAVKAALAAARPRLRLGAETSPGRDAMMVLEKEQQGTGATTTNNVATHNNNNSSTNNSNTKKKKPNFHLEAHRRMYKTRHNHHPSTPAAATTVTATENVVSNPTPVATAPPPPPPPPPLQNDTQEDCREPVEDRAVVDWEDDEQEEERARSQQQQQQPRVPKYPLEKQGVPPQGSEAGAPSETGMSQVTVSSVNFRSEILQPDFDDDDDLVIDEEEEEELAHHPHHHHKEDDVSHNNNNQVEPVPWPETEEAQHLPVSQIRGRFNGSFSPVPTPNPMYSPTPSPAPMIAPVVSPAQPNHVQTNNNTAAPRTPQRQQQPYRSSSPVVGRLSPGALLAQQQQQPKQQSYPYSPHHPYGSALHSSSGRHSPALSNHGSSVMGRQTPSRPASVGVVAMPEGLPDFGPIAMPIIASASVPEKSKSVEPMPSTQVEKEPFHATSPPRPVTSLRARDSGHYHQPVPNNPTPSQALKSFPKHKNKEPEQDASKTTRNTAMQRQQPHGQVEATAAARQEYSNRRGKIDTPGSTNVSKFKAQFENSATTKSWKSDKDATVPNPSSNNNKYQSGVRMALSMESHDQRDVAQQREEEKSKKEIDDLPRASSEEGRSKSVMNFWKSKVGEPSTNDQVEEPVAVAPIAVAKKWVSRKPAAEVVPPQQIVSPVPQAVKPLSVELPVNGDDRAVIEVPEKLSVANMAGRFTRTPQNNVRHASPSKQHLNDHELAAPSSVKSVQSSRMRMGTSSPAPVDRFRSPSPAHSEASADQKCKSGRPSWARQSTEKESLEPPPSPGQVRVIQEQAKWRSPSPQQLETPDSTSSKRWKPPSKKPSWAKSAEEKTFVDNKTTGRTTPSSWRTQNAGSPDFNNARKSFEQNGSDDTKIIELSPTPRAHSKKVGTVNHANSSESPSPVRRAFSPTSSNLNRGEESKGRSSSKEKDDHDLSVMADRESSLLSSDTLENAEPVEPSGARSPSQAERMAARETRGTVASKTHSSPYFQRPPTIPAEARSKDAFEELQKKLMKRQHDMEAMSSASTAQIENLSALTASVLNSEVVSSEVEGTEDETSHSPVSKSNGDEEPFGAAEEPQSSPRTHTLGELAAQSIHAVDYDQTTMGFQAISKSMSRSIDESEPSKEHISSVPSNSQVPDDIVEKIASTSAEDSDLEIHETESDIVFGNPGTYGAAGGDAEEAPPTVADRAKAIANWKGGMGTTPKSVSPEKFEANIRKIQDGRIASLSQQHNAEKLVEENEADPQIPNPKANSAVMRFWKQTSSEDMQEAEQFHSNDPVVADYVSDVQMSDVPEKPIVEINRLISPSVVRDKRHSFRNRTDKQHEGTEKPGAPKKPEQEIANGNAPDPFSSGAVADLVQPTQPKTSPKTSAGTSFDPFWKDGPKNTDSNTVGFGSSNDFSSTAVFGNDGFVKTAAAFAPNTNDGFGAANDDGFGVVNDDGFGDGVDSFGPNKDDGFGAAHPDGFGKSSAKFSSIDNGFGVTADDGFGNTGEIQKDKKNAFAAPATLGPDGFPIDTDFMESTEPDLQFESDFDGFPESDNFVPTQTAESTQLTGEKDLHGFPIGNSGFGSSKTSNPIDNGFGSMDSFGANFVEPRGTPSDEDDDELDAIQEDKEPDELFLPSSSSSLQKKGDEELFSTKKTTTADSHDSTLRPPSRALADDVGHDTTLSFPEEDKQKDVSADTYSQHEESPQPTHPIWSFGSGIENNYFDHHERYEPNQDPIQENDDPVGPDYQQETNESVGIEV